MRLRQPHRQYRLPCYLLTSYSLCKRLRARRDKSSFVLSHTEAAAFYPFAGRPRHYPDNIGGEAPELPSDMPQCRAKRTMTFFEIKRVVPKALAAS